MKILPCGCSQSHAGQVVKVYPGCPSHRRSTSAPPAHLSVPTLRFDGDVYEPPYDRARLTGQILRVYDVMEDGRWRTLEEIALASHAPPASVSAQLRHLRKPRFGSYRVDKRTRGEREHGCWEYRLEVLR